MRQRCADLLEAFASNVGIDGEAPVSPREHLPRARIDESLVAVNGE
jgi:hypothetical protein